MSVNNNEGNTKTPYEQLKADVEKGPKYFVTKHQNKILAVGLFIALRKNRALRKDFQKLVSITKELNAVTQYHQQVLELHEFDLDMLHRGLDGLKGAISIATSKAS